MLKTIRFKANYKQLQALVDKVVNASTPIGLSVLAYNPDQIEVPKDFYLGSSSLLLDYVWCRTGTRRLKSCERV